MGVVLPSPAIDGTPEAPRLPFRTFKPAGVSSGMWHWRASCARPVGTSDRELHWWHRRVESDVAEFVDHVPPQWRNIGRYRHYRVPIPVTVAGEVEWHAWADPDLLSPLLDRMWSIGKKWASGEGAVIDWQVDLAEPDQPDLWGLWWPGTLTPARPMAAHRDAPDDLACLAGVRAPYWHPDRQRRCWAPHVTLHDVAEWLDPARRAAADQTPRTEEVKS